jgi:hypothetical protein
MEYSDFKKDFVERTLTIVRTYTGKYDATLLINCLTGLLILPKEKCYKDIPNNSIENLSDEWGIKKEHIKDVRCTCCGYKLKNVVRQMRNSIAHVNVEACSENGEITTLQFKDTGFKAEIPIESLKIFVNKLATLVIENK